MDLLFAVMGGALGAALILSLFSELRWKKNVERRLAKLEEGSVVQEVIAQD